MTLTTHTDTDNDDDTDHTHRQTYRQTDNDTDHTVIHTTVLRPYHMGQPVLAVTAIKKLKDFVYCQTITFGLGKDARIVNGVNCTVSVPYDIRPQQLLLY